MSVRSTVLAASVLMLALVFAAGTPAKPPSSPGDKQSPSTPTNLRITASSATSISLAWNAGTSKSSDWWYCVQKNGAGCFRVDPPSTTFTMTNLMPDRTTTWTVYAIDASGQPLGQQQRGDPHNPAGHDAAEPGADAVSGHRGPDVDPRHLDEVGRHTDAGLLHARARREVVWDSVGYLFSHGAPTGAVVHARVQGHRTRRLREQRCEQRPDGDDAAEAGRRPPTAPTNLRSGSRAQREAVAVVDSVDRRHRSAVAHPLRGVLQRRAARRDGAIGGGSTIAYCRDSAPPRGRSAVDTSGNVSAPSNAIPFDC